MTISKKKLDDLLDKVSLIQELQKLNGGNPISIWRKRPVIPVAKWESILKGNFRQGLEFIPDGYTNLYDTSFASKTSLMQEIDRTEVEVWKEDYFAFLEHTANPVRGRALCEGCLLKVQDDPFGLRQIFADGLKKKVTAQVDTTKASVGKKELAHSNGDITSKSQVGTSGASYQCAVVNRFACPYKDRRDHYNDMSLIEIGNDVDLIENALTFASEITDDEEQRHLRYDVDFDQDKVVSIGEYTYTGKIDDLPVAKTTTVTHISEIHDVLTKPALLDAVLSQYFSHHAPDLNLKHIRDRLINLVKDHKDEITLKNLRDGCGLDLEDSEEEITRIQKRVAFYSWPGAKCSSCGTNICQIRCLKCDVYICTKHWREHMVQTYCYCSKISSCDLKVWRHEADDECP